MKRKGNFALKGGPALWWNPSVLAWIIFITDGGTRQHVILACMTVNPNDISTSSVSTSDRKHNRKCGLLPSPGFWMYQHFKHERAGFFNHWVSPAIKEFSSCTARRRQGWLISLYLQSLLLMKSQFRILLYCLALWHQTHSITVGVKPTRETQMPVRKSAFPLSIKVKLTIND